MRLFFFLLMCFAIVSDVQAEAPYGELSLSFEANHGQVDEVVRYLARAENYTLFLTDERLALDVGTHALHIDFVGAKQASITGEGLQAGVSHYLIGDESDWIQHVPHFGMVRYVGLYEGIDAVFYGNERRLQYDFIVASHADVSQIRLRFAGAELSLSGGDLLMQLGDVTLTMHAPYTYQMVNGIEHEIESAFVLNGDEVTFSLGDYDASLPLVIDPIFELVFGTYVGGAGSHWHRGMQVVDGYTYLVAMAGGGGYPTTAGAYRTTWPGGLHNVAISKLNQDGTGLVYSTFLGGSTESDEPYGIAVDALGQVYVTGIARSTNFPTTAGAFQHYVVPSSGATIYDAFVTKLSIDGSSLVYSTRFGSQRTATIPNHTTGWAIDIDDDGFAYITGQTATFDLPTTAGVFQPNLAWVSGGLYHDAFVTKFNQNGTGLVWSTYLGGSRYDDRGTQIQVTDTNEVYVAGVSTHNTYLVANNFPTTPGVLYPNVGRNWITRISANADNLLHSTGWPGQIFGMLAVDDGLFVTGYGNVPTTSGAYRETASYSREGYVTKIDPTFSTVMASTFLGTNTSSSDIYINAITLDASQNVYVAGATAGMYPVTPDAFQATQGSAGWMSGVFSILNPDLTTLLYSTYLGGNRQDEIQDIAVDATGVYLSGTTFSNNIPTTSNAFQSNYPSSFDEMWGNLFVIKLRPRPPGVGVAPLVLDIPEGSNATYEVVLLSQPTDDVTIILSTPSSELVFSTPSLTFTSGDWDVPQTVTVSVPDDDIAQGDRSTIINHTVNSLDASYESIPADSVTVNITDDDSAGVVVAPLVLNIPEGDSDVYTVVLTSQPSDDVTVILSTPSSELVFSVPTLTFTSGDWDTPQTVSVSVPDDDIAQGDRTTVINHTASSPDASYDGIGADSVTVNITDDDSAGVVVAPLVLDIPEGDSDVYTVVLTSQPTDDVTITLSTPSTELVFSAPTLIFTSGDWDTPQTVTVSVPDDDIAQGDRSTIINHTASSPDASYDDIPADSVVVNITDDDSAGVVVAPLVLNIPEGDSDVYTVVLTSQPTDDVTITLSTPSSELMFSAPTLTFTSGDWDVPQTVTVSVPDDDIAQGDRSTIINHAPTSLDASYDGIPTDSVVVNITDDDSAGVVVVPLVLNIPEGDSDVYTVVLTSQPSDDVTITLSTPSTELVFSVPTLTFTSGDWNVPQTVTVSVPDDDIAQGDRTTIINHTVSSPDAGYDGIPADSVTVNIIDDDSPNIIITPTNLTINEGDSETYQIRLTTQPTDTVTVTLNTPSSELNTTPDTVIFTPIDWDVPQTVTVNVPDNDMDEGDRTTGITHTVTSPDPAYDGIPASNVNVTILDDDSVGVEISTMSLIIPEGDSATYTIRLDSEPTDPVTLTLTPMSPDVTVTPPSITFDEANWDVPQTITVQAEDNLIEDGNRTVWIDHIISSPDPNYDGGSIGLISVHIIDDETAGVVLIGASDLTVDENNTASYEIHLTTQPTAPVTVIMTTTSPDVTLVPTMLTFDQTNWNVPQTVTVEGNGISQNEVIVLQHEVISLDPVYDGMSVVDVPVNLRAEAIQAQNEAIVDENVPNLRLIGVSVTGENGEGIAPPESVAIWTYDLINEGAPLENVTATVTYPDDLTGITTNQSCVFETGSLLTICPIASMQTGENMRLIIATRLPNRAGIYEGILTANASSDRAILSILSVQNLPQTGESPWWRSWVILGVVLVTLLTISLIWRRRYVR